MKISFSVTQALLIFFLLATTADAQTSASVNVPATASGGFGLPNTGYGAMIAAKTISGAGTVIIQATGTWNWCPGCSAPATGATWSATNGYTPLQEAAGISGLSSSLTDRAWGALMGAFVPESTATATGFSPLDSTKALSTYGIPPSALFFVGTYYAFQAPGPGILYLGINDNGVSDNSGSLSVTVSSP